MRRITALAGVLGALAAGAAGLGPGPVAAQNGPPTVCDAPPNVFEPGPRTTLDEVHRRALDVVTGNLSQAAAADAASLTGPLSSLADRLDREGRSTQAALVRADLARLYEIAGGVDQERIARLRRQASDVLANATDREGVEVYIVLANRARSRVGEEEHRHALAMIERHERVAGPHPNTMPLWKTAIRRAPSRTVGERVARRQLEAALRAGNARWELEARGALLTHLGQTLTGRYNLEPPELRKHRAAGADLLALARPMERELTRRANWDPREGAAFCDWMGGFDAYSVTVRAFGTRAEIEEVLRLEVATMRGAFETDFAGAASNLSPIVTTRLFDRDLYLRGMASVWLQPADGSCPADAREICSLQLAAEAYTSIGAPSIAAIFLRDALDVAAEKEIPPHYLRGVLAAAAELEWRYGAASSSPELLSRLVSITGGEVASGTTEVALSARLLRAVHADARYDDAVAIEAFGELVDLAVEASQDLLSADDRWSPEAWQASSLARELTERHLRGFFCAGCADDGGLAAPALAWLEALFDPAAPAGFVPRPLEYILVSSLPEKVWPAEKARRADRRFRDTLHPQDGQGGIGALPFYEAARRVAPRRWTEREVLRATALGAVLGGADDISILNAQGPDAFYAFLFERDLARKRRMWSDYLAPISDHFGQFGDEIGLYETLDALARAAADANYPLAARVLFESALEEMADGASLGRPTTDGFRRQLEDLGVLPVGALVRLAGYSLNAGEWRLASDQLDLAGELIRRRLALEWRVGNVRAAESLRAYAPAARAVAQLRAWIAQDPRGRAAAPGASARLVEDLQVAMLSETALATSAAQQRLITADPALAKLVDRRELVGAGIADIEALEWYADWWGPAPVEVLTRDLVAARDAAQAEIDRLMPVPEDLITPEPLPLAEARAGLRPDEGLLVLHAGTRHVYGMLVRPTGEPLVWVVPVAMDDLAARIAAVRRGVDLAGGILQEFPFGEAHVLYELLLGPAEAALDGVDHLLFVADGPLASLPLAILPKQVVETPPLFPDEMRDTRIPWFLRDHAVTVLPSVRALATRAQPALASRARLAFAGLGAPVLLGDPQFTRSADPADLFGADGGIDLELLRNLPALPETEGEIARLGAALGARPQDLLVGETASEATLKGMRLSDYRVLAFATHGLVAGELRGTSEPGLVLTPPERASAEDDGFLGASEIAALELDADLVVLSACNTATSDGRPRAEGFSGLARAFFAAGARSVVASHWAIPSEPAVEVTTRIVSARAEDPDLDWGRALRRAMLAVADEVGPAEYGHPANWGAFVAVGLPPGGR